MPLATFKLRARKLVVDVVLDPGALGAAHERGAAELVAAVLQNAVQANAAAARVGGNRGRADRHFRLQRVVQEAQRRALVALDRHAFDELIAVEAAETAGTQAHLLGRLHAAHIGRVRAARRGQSPRGP